MKKSVYEYLMDPQHCSIDALNDTEKVAKELGVSSLEISKELARLYDICADDLAFKVIDTRTGIKVVNCRTVFTSDAKVQVIKKELNLIGEGYDVDSHIRFLCNQLYESVPVFMFYKIAELYFRINTYLDNLVNPTLKEVHVTTEYLNGKQITEDVVNCILQSGYARKSDDGNGFIWKVYNTNPTTEVVAEEETKLYVDAMMLKEATNNTLVTIKFLTENLMKDLGIVTQQEINSEDLLKDLDNMFEEYESMEDWEKIKNTQSFINKWKDIRVRHFVRD